MADLLNSEDFGLKIYNRFPPIYRQDDIVTKFALKRYLSALGDGGFKHIIEDTNRLTTLVDSNRVDYNILPILFKQYGLEIFNGIPEPFLRYLLPRLGELWQKKGSLDALEYFVSYITGIKSFITVDFDDFNNPYVTIKLDMDTRLYSDFFPDAGKFETLTRHFIPFYCDPYIIYSFFYQEFLGLNQFADKESMKIVDHKDDIGVLFSKRRFQTLDPRLNVLTSLLNSTFLTNKDFEPLFKMLNESDRLLNSSFSTQRFIQSSMEVDVDDYFDIILSKTTDDVYLFGLDKSNYLVRNFKEDSFNVSVNDKFKCIISLYNKESENVVTEESILNRMLNHYKEGHTFNSTGIEVNSNLLNYSEGLITNSIGSYDIINTKDGRTTIFYIN